MNVPYGNDMEGCEKCENAIIECTCNEKFEAVFTNSDEKGIDSKWVSNNSLTIFECINLIDVMLKGMKMQVEDFIRSKPPHFVMTAALDKYKEAVKSMTYTKEMFESYKNYCDKNLFTFEEDDKGVLCRYSEDGGWDPVEEYCVTCGYKEERCECEEYIPEIHFTDVKCQVCNEGNCDSFYYNGTAYHADCECK
jgi:hypothetical protein